MNVGEGAFLAETLFEYRPKQLRSCVSTSVLPLSMTAETKGNSLRSAASLNSINFENIDIDAIDIETPNEALFNAASPPLPLREGWRDQLRALMKAGAIIVPQSFINAPLLLKSIRGELGLGTDLLSNEKGWLFQALLVSGVSDWLITLTDTAYMQTFLYLAHKHNLPLKELTASILTCLFDVILTTPIMDFRQKIATEQCSSIANAFQETHLSSAYAGTYEVLTNNLLYMALFYTLNEKGVQYFKAHHNELKQMAIGLTASVIAGTIARPAEWLRSQVSLEKNLDKNMIDILKEIHFNPLKMFGGYLSFLGVLTTIGIFSSLAHKYLRQVDALSTEPPKVKETEFELSDNHHCETAHILDKPFDVGLKGYGSVCSEVV